MNLEQQIEKLKKKIEVKTQQITTISNPRYAR